MSRYTVTTRPHVVTLDDGREQSLNQSYVEVDGSHVGFIGDQPGAPLNFVYPLPDDVVEACVDHIRTTRGFAPATSQPLDPKVLEALAKAA